MRAAIATGVVFTTVGLSVAGLGAQTALGAAATVATTATKPTGPSVAGTSQSLTVGMGTTDDPFYSYDVDFATTTFTIPALGDSGTFKLKGTTLTLTIHASAGRDKGCTFPGAYSASSTRYAGTYTCRQHDRDSFTLTTTGAAGS